MGLHEWPHIKTEEKMLEIIHVLAFGIATSFALKCLEWDIKDLFK